MALTTRSNIEPKGRWRLASASRSAGEWLVSDHSSNLPLDLGLVGALVLAVATKEVVMWFHMIFVLLVVAALMLPFRQFVIRLVVWMTITVALVTWAITSLDTPSDEITELPLLTLVLVLVYLVAQARARAAREAEGAFAELERRTEVESEVLQRQLEDAQRRELIGRASAGLAHDLRNVFVVISGCVDEVHERAAVGAGGALEDDVSCVDDVGAAAERGLAIIDDLLWLGQRHDYETRVTDLGESIRQIEPFLRRMVRPGITLRVEAPAQPSLVFIDHVGLSQVLMNLVANAIDAIEGAGHITVSTRQSVSGSAGGELNTTTSISVTDDGAGFTKQAIEHAFEADFTTKSGAHGGYGLPTVWRIVDRCGGSIQIDSSPDSGTSVILRFETVGTDATEPTTGAQAQTATDFATDVLSESDR
ncbi:MAG TPA: ATP-binding protein [Ilumatobacteraceae bacterium]|nr:ATP-binding protein [Ilumatobacteraceae bacterium]